MNSVLGVVLLESYGWSSLLFVLLIIACPLGMWIMMRGKHGGSGSEGGSSKKPTKHGGSDDESLNK